MLPYFLRHYENICESIVIYDNGSDDGSQSLVLAHPICQLRHIESNGRMQEDTLRELKGNAWKESRDSADWVICCDVDEFLFHPHLLDYLEDCRHNGITLPVPQGFQMVAAAYPTTQKQIYDEVRTGFRDDWYSKRIVFNPSAIQEINYSHGCHGASPVGDVQEAADPALKMLHYKYLGLEDITARHAAMKARQSDFDRNRGFGFQYNWSADETARQFSDFQRRAEPLDLGAELH